MDECLLYIEESLVHCAFASPGTDAALQKLAGILNAGVLFESLKRRVADLRKNVKGASVELVSIQKMTTVITDTQQGKVQDIMHVNNAKLFDMHRHLEESMANVDILKALISGIFAMELFDRLFVVGMFASIVLVMACGRGSCGPIPTNDGSRGLAQCAYNIFAPCTGHYDLQDPQGRSAVSILPGMWCQPAGAALRM